MSNEGWDKPEGVTDEEWEKLEEWEKAEFARTWADTTDYSPDDEGCGGDLGRATPAFPGRAKFDDKLSYFVAAAQGDAAIVGELIKKDIDPDTSLSIIGPWPTVFVRSEVAPGSTALHLAAAFGHVEVAEVVLAAGGDVCVRDAEELSQRTPLHIAAFWGQTDIARILVSSGADVNTLDAHGLTPLREAAMGSGPGPDRMKVAELLLAAGADVNYGAYAPLHDAAQCGDVEMVRLLLDAGADIDIKNRLRFVDLRHLSGLSPLHYAAWYGCTEVVELLLDRDASVNAKSDAGQTPLYVAMSAGHSETADLLRRHGGIERARPWWAFWR